MNSKVISENWRNGAVIMIISYMVSVSGNKTCLKNSSLRYLNLKIMIEYR